LGIGLSQILLQGFLLQASLILALGAQNIFVLDSGLRKQRHLVVALVAAICDTFLIFISVLGVATLFIQQPILKIALGILGVGFLFFYGMIKIREAGKGVELSQQSKQTHTFRQTVLVSLGFSLLNPHVYLDTVVLIGGYSSKFGLLNERFAFGLGASIASTIWFFGLVFLASLGSRLLNHKGAMRVVSLLSGLILIALAVRLSFDVMVWIEQNS
jgi:L-lysine exporter family protein LysE/ArgO